MIIVNLENPKETTKDIKEATDDVQETTDAVEITVDDLMEVTDVRKPGSSDAKNEDTEPMVCPMFWSGLIEEEEDVGAGCRGQGVSCLQKKRSCHGI